VFAGKKRMGQRGQRERVRLYFSTSCLFPCVRIGCQGGIRCTLVVCSIKSGYESHSWFGKFGLIGLWVAGYSFCENVHADRHCDPRDARLAVHLCTTDGAPADCVELNHQNQGGPKSQCGHYPKKRRVRGRDGVV